MTYDDLTDAQKALYDEVEQHDGDGRDYLRSRTEPAADKTAVAEVLGGPGAGDEFR